MTLEQLNKLAGTNQIKPQDVITYFKGIPAKNWCIEKLIDRDTGQRCARGHLGINNCWERSPADDYVFNVLRAKDLVHINNGTLDPVTKQYEYPPTKSVEKRSKGIKTRVIKYLKSLIPSTTT